METLHPIVVHFPMALAVIQPLLLLGILVLIARGDFTEKTWWIAVLLQAILVVSAFLALKSGGVDEKIVKKVVQKSLVEEHEEAAEAFFAFALALFGILAVPLFWKAYASWLRIAGFVLSLVVLGLGIRVGSLGGDLVYKHNAASAHAERYAARQEAGDSGLSFLDLLFGASGDDSDSD